MKRFVLDTDMGVDCDDAVALALLLNAQEEGKCLLPAITLSTTRSGAVSTVRAILKHYQTDVKNIGILKKKVLNCDSLNYYSADVMKRFGADDHAEDSVVVLRKTLAESNEKISIIAIGPQTNLQLLLESNEDNISPLTGYELVKEKVDYLYVMGGCFSKEKMSEWNLLQDVGSAIEVADKWPTPITYLPHEVGFLIFTKMEKNFDNPVWFSMYSFAKNMGEYKENYARYSWDPVTCMYALGLYNDLFDLSANGEVIVNEKAETVFVENPKGNRNFITLQSKLSTIEKTLNSLIERR